MGVAFHYSIGEYATDSEHTIDAKLGGADKEGKQVADASASSEPGSLGLSLRPLTRAAAMKLCIAQAWPRVQVLCARQPWTTAA